MSVLRTLAVNVLGVVEHPASGPSPYRIGRDGHPYVPTGDGGVVLGVELGDGAWQHEADHVTPGACLVHPDPAARLALTGLACIGDAAVVRTGAASGATGVVVGKRGEEGRVVVAFEQAVLATLRPGDQVSVRAEGQGSELEWAGGPGGNTTVALRNVRRELLELLGIRRSDKLHVPVRCALPSKLMGNGIGRPAVQWCLDVQLNEETAAAFGASGLALGDLVAIHDVDARFNIGYRRGYTTVGAVVHGGSPLPGHGPGIDVLLTGPSECFELEVDPQAHRGLSMAVLA